jgi:hypothetical protein
MQVKMTLRFSLSPVRMTIKKTNSKKCGWGYGGKGTLLCCWWECKLVQPLWKSVWRFLKKLKTELPNDCTLPIVGIYLKESLSQTTTETLAHHVLAALFTVATLWKQPRWPSTDEWVKKMWYVVTMEYYATVMKNEIMWFEVIMEPGIITVREIRQTQICRI